MKKIIITTLIAIAYLEAFAQTLYVPTGTSGISNNSPASHVEFNSNNLWNGSLRVNGTGYTSFGLYESGNLKWSIYQHPGLGSNLLLANSAGQDKFVFTQDGKFGVGQIAPSHALSIFLI